MILPDTLHEILMNQGYGEMFLQDTSDEIFMNRCFISFIKERNYVYYY